MRLLQGLLSIMMMLLIGVQSVTAAVDPGNFHQPDQAHLQTKHVHDDNYSVSDRLIFDEQGHVISDCHHCGHCSGSHTIWMSARLAMVSGLINCDPAFLPGDTQVRRRIESQFKPPIA
ncbi:hypothetical protein [Pseudoalteromonas rubra]|nr:hypothetical protein [Pseudoalteromonas rubra]